MRIEGGVVKTLLSEFKAAARTSGTINAGEVRRILGKGVKTIKDDFSGADSEKGLSKDRDALARTFRAADKNWSVSPAGLKAAKEILGRELNGKGGSLAKVEASIRHTVGSTVISYSG